MPLRCLFLALPVALAAAVGCFRATPTGTAKPVKLVVVVVFDQLRGDYLDRWRPLFGRDGFRRLQNDGAWFANCHYPFATTATGPGHAAILSGCSGDKNGIVNNEWYDRAAAEKVYCASTPRYQFVPGKKPVLDENGKPKKKQPEAGNPDRLLSPTVADSLAATTGGAAKIVGLSLKDRSSVLPLGHSRGTAYWFDNTFRTSTYYRETLPKWVQDFNAGGTADSFSGTEWTRLRDPALYDRFAGPDVAPGEAIDRHKKEQYTAAVAAARKTGDPAPPEPSFVAFPHPFGTAPGSGYYGSVAASPAGNELLAAFTKACVAGENLGRNPTPDLLVVSFSSNDLVGHAYGPDSHEVLDITLRSDAMMADLLRFFDRTVGAGNYAVVLTADHGICPLPEVEAGKGRDAKRVPAAGILAAAEHHLGALFGAPTADPSKPGKKPRFIEESAFPSVHLNPRLLAAMKLDPGLVALELARWLPTQDGIAAAYTRAELLGEIPATDAVGKRVQKSFHPDRSGDVLVVTKPFYLLTEEYATGTNHGTPHAYDTHVPLIVYGPGVAGGRRSEAVTPQHAAPIAAAFLGVPPPRDCEYTVPATLTRP